MAENNRPVSEPLQKGAQAAQMVRGAVKTGKALAGQRKGLPPAVRMVRLRFCLGKP